MSAKSLKELIAAEQDSNEFWSEVAILEFTSELRQFMKQNNISYTQLADMIGTSKSYISKVFGGNANFTIQTMVKFTRALGGKLHFHIAEESAGVKWLDFHDDQQKAKEVQSKPETQFYWGEPTGLEVFMAADAAISWPSRNEKLITRQPKAIECETELLNAAA